MNIFQGIGLALVAALLAVSLRGWWQRRRLFSPSLAWVVLWCGAALAIAQPGLTQSAARLLGIGRGADLVLYCAVLGMCVGFFALFRRNRSLDRDITLLVRHIAIVDCEVREGSTGEGTRASTAAGAGRG